MKNGDVGKPNQTEHKTCVVIQEFQCASFWFGRRVKRTQDFSYVWHLRRCWEGKIDTRMVNGFSTSYFKTLCVPFVYHPIIIFHYLFSFCYLMFFFFIFQREREKRWNDSNDTKAMYNMNDGWIIWSQKIRPDWRFWSEEELKRFVMTKITSIVLGINWPNNS